MDQTMAMSSPLTSYGTSSTRRVPTRTLIAVGIWFTVRTRGLQFRLFGQMLRAIAGSRAGGEGISSFQAFTIGLASRVGTGNIVGVALAIILGGPGAVFWMWVVALVGMATGFIESTLAQMYKIRHPEGTFRGGYSDRKSVL